nr:hypothetical protein [Tanacetum cinerariifolium]
MTFEEIEAKYTTVWKQLEDFIPIGSKEEAERFKRKGLNLEQESVKKLRTSEEVPEEVKSPDEVPEEKVKEMMQLVHIEEVYVEALQVKHPIIDWKVHTEGQRSYWKIIRLGGSSASYQFFMDLLKHLDREDLNQLWALVKESLNIRLTSSDKEMELWVELKRLYEPDDEDQLWTHTQNLMHALVEWKMYDTCGVHHVTSKNREIFMLVEKDYPLRKGLAIVMICYKLQVENYSQMANDLIMKIYKILEHQDKMSRDVITVGSTMQIPLLYRGEYSQWRERFMNYLEEQTDGEAMINSIQNDRKAAILYEYETFKATEGEQLLDTYLYYLQVINDLKKYGYKKDNYPLALVTDETKVSKRKEKVVVSSDFEGSGADDFSKLKRITALLAKAFNRRKFYSKPINNNLRTSSTSQSANKKQEFVKSNDKKVKKKDDEKKRDMSKVKCYNCKKEGHFAKDY